MAEIKIGIWLLNILGFPLYGFILLNYWGEFQSWIMLILGGIFVTVKIVGAVVRIYFFWIKSKQDVKMRNLRIEERESEVHDE